MKLKLLSAREIEKGERMMKMDEILLGDAYELIKEVPDKSVDLIITDPPYKIEGLRGGRTGIFSHHSVLYTDELKKDESRIVNGIDNAILDEFVLVMKKVNCYIWCNKEQIYDYMTFFVKEMGCNFEFLIWEKENVPPFYSGHFLKDKEYCLHFWETGAKLLFESFDEARTVFHSGKNLEDKKLYGHPTIKPQKFIELMVKASSERGSVVLDPFSGSGTTACACKALGRHFIAFEIDNGYWEASVDRLKGITKAERDSGLVQMKLF